MYLKLECTVWICSCKPQCVHVNVRQRSVRFGVVSSLYSKSKSKKEETISSIKQFIFTFSIMIKNILRALSWHLLWYRDVCHMINMLKLLEIWQWKEWNVTKNQAKRLCKRHTQPSVIWWESKFADSGTSKQATEERVRQPLWAQQLSYTLTPEPAFHSGLNLHTHLVHQRGICCRKKQKENVRRKTEEANKSWTNEL